MWDILWWFLIIHKRFKSLNLKGNLCKDLSVFWEIYISVSIYQERMNWKICSFISNKYRDVKKKTIYIDVARTCFASCEKLITFHHLPFPFARDATTHSDAQAIEEDFLIIFPSSDTLDITWNSSWIQFHLQRAFDAGRVLCGVLFITQVPFTHFSFVHLKQMRKGREKGNKHAQLPDRVWKFLNKGIIGEVVGC